MRDCLENLMSEKLINIKNELKDNGLELLRIFDIESVVHFKHKEELSRHYLMPFLNECYSDFKVAYFEITGRKYINTYIVENVYEEDDFK